MAKDLVYQAAKNALIKDNWLITHDPYTISFGGVNMAVDLGAEKLIAATKDNQKIAVEIKSFLERSSAISEFHTALAWWCRKLLNSLLVKSSDHFCEFVGTREVRLSDLVQLQVT